MKLSMVIPCYHEAGNIASLAAAFADTKSSRMGLELILVDNGSQDQTGLEIDQMVERYPFIKKVEVPVNQGYGYGIKQGLQAATGDYVGWMHADLQIFPKEVDKAFFMLQEKGFPRKIMVKGCRTNRPFLSRMISFGMECYESALFHTRLHEINAQPTIFSRDIYQNWDDYAPNGFELDLYAYLQAKQQNAQIVRWKVKQQDRTVGESSWDKGLKSKWNLSRRVIKESKRLKKKYR